MKNNLKTINIPLFICFILLILIIGWIYQDIIFSPNSHLLQQNGDGLKNYFLFAWVAKYGSLSGFTGTNYPFGETILYTDSMPFLSLSLYYLSSIFTILPKYSIGILHSSMLILFPISFFYTYKIFKYYNVNNWIAALGALLIVLNCPSNSRILLHFGLFYIILFPILLYFVLTFQKSSFRPFQLFFGLLIGYFIHGYTGALWSGIIISFFTIKLFVNKNKKTKLIGFLISLAPTIIYFFLISISDDHLWRSKHPLALFDYKITFYHLFGIFLGKELHIFQVLQFNYWFWSSIIITFYFLIKNKKNTKNYLFQDSTIIFFLGVAYIIYGTSIILKFQSILILFPQLEQLRDLQRFGWVGFISITIPLIIVQDKVTPKLLIIFLLFIGINEGIRYNNNIINHTESIENPFKYLSSINKYEALKNKYSCILSIPFHYNANLNQEEENQLTINQYHLTYTTGIPSINAYLSRLSSEEENLKQLFILPSLKKKTILHQYFNQKDSILVIKGNDLTKTPSDLPLVSIGQIDSIKIYKGFSKDFIQNTVSYDTLINKALVYEEFSNQNINNGLFDKGAKIIKTHGKNIIFKENKLYYDTTQNYHLSIWIYHHQMDSLYLNHLQLEQNNTVIGKKSLGNGFKYFDEKWGCLDFAFKPISEKDPLKLFIISRKEKSVFWYEKFFPKPEEEKTRKQPLLFDDLLIYYDE